MAKLKEGIVNGTEAYMKAIDKQRFEQYLDKESPLGSKH